jgi:hypothetical protein
MLLRRSPLQHRRATAETQSNNHQTLQLTKVGAAPLTERGPLLAAALLLVTAIEKGVPALEARAKIMTLEVEEGHPLHLIPADINTKRRRRTRSIRKEADALLKRRKNSKCKPA